MSDPKFNTATLVVKLANIIVSRVLGIVQDVMITTICLSSWHSFVLMDFKKIKLTYKGSELVKTANENGPAFRRIYQIFGASYPGEYMPPRNGDAVEIGRAHV